MYFKQLTLRYLFPLMGLLLALTGAASAQSPLGARQVSPSQSALYPHTAGRTVVWMDLRGPGRHNTDIYAARLGGGSEIGVATGAQMQDTPDLRAIWSSGPSAWEQVPSTVTSWSKTSVPASSLTSPPARLPRAILRCPAGGSSGSRQATRASGCLCATLPP
jgi:hypothetical protein